MQRFAVLVDAGYLLHVGAVLVCGPGARRGDASCNYRELVSAIQGFAAEKSGLEILRTYWYDAAREGPLSAEFQTVAALDNVKLRLGRLVGDAQKGAESLVQKGVDSLVMRDLMTLARERAIATAYLFGGDDDHREGVAAAQDMGVRVVLVGIEGF